MKANMLFTNILKIKQPIHEHWGIPFNKYVYKLFLLEILTFCNLRHKCGLLHTGTATPAS